MSEPFLAWTTSGEAEFQERENSRQPWTTHRIRKGSFFLTSGGAPYDCRWRAIGWEPFETMYVYMELPVLQRALEEVFGPDAPNARLRDLPAFTDVVLDSLMERLREELMRQHASPPYLHAIAHATAVQGKPVGSDYQALAVLFQAQPLMMDALKAHRQSVSRSAGMRHKAHKGIGFT